MPNERNSTYGPSQKPYRARSHFFTLNNHTENDGDHLTSGFEKITQGVNKYLFQEEVGEEKGTPHLNGTVTFKNKVFRHTLMKINPRVHWMHCDNVPACYNYCKKDKTRMIGGKRWDFGTKKPPAKLTEQQLADNMHNTLISNLNVIEDEEKKDPWEPMNGFYEVAEPRNEELIMNPPSWWLGEGSVYEAKRKEHNLAP